MSYQALYRAWRPDSFHDICGQSQIVTTLVRQIETGRVAHAYLFCGSRGTGKTTTAKVFARAINCQHPVDGEPCGECEACVELSRENNMDIIEIDAASNNGVDEIRDLREKVKYPPSIGRYKVYIIDEVHMLSAGAFNALLKTLEEPPAHAVFILATTEPQRLPATILSRCQRYDFHRMNVDTLIDRMMTVLGGVGRVADDDALTEIARAAEGGMRDALSILDMCLSYTEGDLTSAIVEEVLGTAGRAFLFEFAGSMLSHDAAGVLKLIDRMMTEGRDPAVLTRDLTGHFRNLLLARAVGDDLAALLDTTPEDAAQYIAQSKEAQDDQLMRLMDLLIQSENDMKWATRPRTILELTCVRACRPEKEDTALALTERLTRLEKAVSEGTVIAPSNPTAAPKPAPAAPQAKRAEKPAVTGPDADKFKQAIDALSASNPSIRATLSSMRFVSFENGAVNVEFQKARLMHMRMLERKQPVLEEALTAAFGQPVRLTMRLEEDATTPTASRSTRQTLEQAYDVFGRENVEITE